MQICHCFIHLEPNCQINNYQYLPHYFTIEILIMFIFHLVHRYVVMELEKGKESEAEQRKTMLRSKLSKIISCDLTHSYPLSESLPLFDVLSVNFCVEVVATDVKMFTQYIKALWSLLKDGGFLSIFVSLEESYYVNQSTRYNHLFVTSEDVQGALKKSGFELLKVHHLDVPLKSQIPTFNDCKALEHFVAKKH